MGAVQNDSSMTYTYEAVYLNNLVRKLQTASNMRWCDEEYIFYK
jgi:hypothetical protein